MPDKIDKLRTKVRKACDNCRKRKLRCTGKQPCSTCEAYSCPCIYSARSSTAKRGRAKKIRMHIPITLSNKALQDTTIQNNDDDGDDDIDSVDNTSNIRNNNSNGTVGDISQEDGKSLPAPTSVPYMNASNTMHLPESTLQSPTFYNNKQNLTNDIKSHMNPTTEINTTNGGNSRSPSAIPKYPHVADFITQVPPLITGNNQLYQDDIAFQMKINSLATALESLKSITFQDQSISQSIEKITNQINELVDSCKPQLDMPAFLEKSHQKRTSPASEKSLETSLLRNKYTDRVCLTRFAIWSDSTVKNNKTKEKTTQFESEEPLITEMFGLYSPFQAISFRGIGYACLDHLRRNNGQIKRQVKETLYLILRYFDMCFIQLNEGKSLIANPLDNYSSRKSLPAMPQSPDAPIMTPSPGPSGGFTIGGGNGVHGVGTNGSTGSASSSKRNTIVQFIRRFPQPFVYEISGVTSEMLLDNIGDPLTIFQLLLKIFNEFKTAYESFMVEMTSCTLRLENKVPTFSNQVIQKLLFFSETEQLLFPLCYQYYNETQFFYYKSPRSIDYVELLLSLVDKQLASYDYYSATLLMDAAVNRALKMGLYRWEYYVGLDEANAERRRRIWWGLYYFDKLISVTLGEPSTINDSIMSCLLPPVFRDIGFLDSKTFVRNVHLFNLESAFDNMDIDTLVHYGRLGIIQLVSDFQINVLYNEKYTSIRNTAVPPLVKSRLFQELVGEYDLLRTKLQALRNHCSRLFELASSVRNANGEAVLNDKVYHNDEINAASRFSCSFEFHFSVVLSTIDNLEARLSSPPYTKPQFTAVADIFHEIYYSWNRMNLFLSNVTNDYSFIRVFMYFRCVTILFITKSDVLKAMITRDDLRSMVLALHKLRCLWILTLHENYPQVRESSLYGEYCKNLSFLCLACRILVHQYLNQHSIEMEELLTWFQQNSPELVDTFRSCIDISSPTYKYLLMPVQRSGFHLHVRRMLESNFLSKAKTKAKQNKKSKHPTSRSEPINMHPPMVFASPLTHNTTPPPPIHPNSVPMGGMPIPNTGYRGVVPVSNLITPDMSNSAHPVEGLNNMPMPPYSHSGTGFGIPPNGVHDHPGVNPNMSPGHRSSMFPFGENSNPSEAYMQNMNSQGPRSLAASFNLGTLDEFVNSDIGSIYNILWSDLYPEGDNLN
ncbi:similar to Saccharomyces cerevisiae YGL013C PDR1 Zinc cluster protein [Maudiozyma barnettii]|uniref:Similar to Saccharomyces cerevisiae YGL013C PDR1 Zinc cluster protein n=1 Tax=Maudiozyma barnettii TaxID=61262 RepID=A0A8H2VJ72_9SACH|nr:drug-responsive transcription factor PDR1 [Kazachstania barnettii]CAB4256736.1 similar to Saccharomyces cerevisiae YGL013C PDR1 Zinc cluster protein [Kazachstania barnettii]CAD1785392.1 similar to Saccharomyces cerevisiae YGL013C PDR1 Zinc cluster protein [Kazachstania barnettii]